MSSGNEGGTRGGETSSGKNSPALEDRNNFTDLEVYSDLSPAVTKTFRLLESMEEFNTFYDFILESIKQDTAGLLPRLADGYNLYHYSDKAEAYTDVRSGASRVQSRLLILSNLDFLGTHQVDDVCRDLELCINRLSGLIRKMEEQAG